MDATSAREAVAAWEALRAQYHGADCRTMGSRELRRVRDAIASALVNLEQAMAYRDATGALVVPLVPGVHVPGYGGGYRVTMPSAGDAARCVVAQSRKLGPIVSALGGGR